MRLIFGFLLFIVLVAQPLYANFLSALALKTDLDPKAKVTLLDIAADTDKCNHAILDKLGDNWAITKNFIMAAHSYGRIIQCSPGNSLARFKYGETILMLGFIIGDFAIKEALALEPNNPFYIRENQRLKERQHQ